ncbi:hypothetical protein pb186bvf_006951 [Paramecium bursaria]
MENPNEQLQEIFQSQIELNILQSTIFSKYFFIVNEYKYICIRLCKGIKILYFLGQTHKD